MLSPRIEAQKTEDSFGSGTNAFTIPFVPIGDPGNPPDPSTSFSNHWASPKPPDDARLGAVGYEYRMGVYEISNAIVEKANRLGQLLISNTNANFVPAYWGLNKPATFMSYQEMARFVNWLNETTGHPPAYKFDEFGNWQLWPPDEAWQVDGQNLYRHKDAFYFLPSANEWHKAGYWDPVAHRYWKYPTGSDTQPFPVAGGTAPMTTVSFQPREAGPADVENAGGLSPYGTMAQAGNLMDWNESAFDGTNDSTSELIHIRGDKWYDAPGDSDYSDPWYPYEGGVADCCTFRVASLPALVGDSDGDGVDDRDELIAGTNPGDGADFLRLEVALASEGVELRFQTVAAPSYGYMDPQRYYALETTTEPAGNLWRGVDGYGRILGTNQTVFLRPALAEGTPRFFRLRVWLEAATMPQPLRGELSTDNFGNGTNAFAIDFVKVGDPGNADNASLAPPIGGVGYSYRIGKYEVSEDLVTKANLLGGLKITFSALGPRKPATKMTFAERARFVNWLNTSTGHHAAYNFDAKGVWQLWAADEAWTLDGTNLYRHKDAFYFLPSVDEWYKAGYFNGTRYFAYAIGSDIEPIPVASGQVGGTTVYLQAKDGGPADVDDAGGLSFYGTMAQGGNVREFLETALSGTNNSTSTILMLRGGAWLHNYGPIQGLGGGEGSWAESDQWGFRVAAQIRPPPPGP